MTGRSARKGLLLAWVCCHCSKLLCCVVDLSITGINQSINNLYLYTISIKATLRLWGREWNVTKISSCGVNTTSRQGIKQLGISFGSIFL